MPDSDGQSDNFDIGLVMAGAISAGAYTAGVVDYLLEALDRWQRAKEAEERRDAGNGATHRIPSHDVRIRVVSGASAGGIISAIMASMLRGELAPVDDLAEATPAGTPRNAERNPLYASWVQRIDMEHLLGGRDLLKERQIVSALDSTVLEEIAKKALEVEPRGARWAFVTDPFDLYLSVTNLRGIPYEIPTARPRHEGHLMTNHGDFVRFEIRGLGAEAPVIEGERGAPIVLGNDTGDAWKKLADAALATSAFPGGLAPREFERSSRVYVEREWRVPNSPDSGSHPSPNGCWRLDTIKPAFRKREHDDRDLGKDNFRFLSVDGGLISNEPLELARRAFAGQVGHNDRRATVSRHAVLMIDPFPSYERDDSEAAYTPNKNIFSVIGAMFGALKSHARFKPDELVLALDEGVFSRFLVVPVRRRRNETGGSTKKCEKGDQGRDDDADKRIERHSIASGALEGFGGFLSESFRRHDFQLGRRNCQRFLEKHFVLSAEHEIFKPWREGLKKLDPETGRNLYDRFAVKRDGAEFLPIVPVLGDPDPLSCPRPVVALDWPALGFREMVPLWLRIWRRLALLMIFIVPTLRRTMRKPGNGRRGVRGRAGAKFVHTVMRWLFNVLLVLVLIPFFVTATPLLLVLTPFIASRIVGAVRDDLISRGQYRPS